MRVARILRAAHAGEYQPMIHFLGKRPEGQHSSSPAPHPAAPKDVISSSFLSKLSNQSSEMRSPTSASSGYSGHRQSPASHTDSTSQSASSQSQSQSGSANGNGTSSQKSDSTEGPIKTKPADYEYFWEAPSYLWEPKEVSERELEAVMSGGATDIRSGP